MKKFTKITSIVLAIAILCGLQSTSFAAENLSQEWILKESNSLGTYIENTITGEKIIQACEYDQEGNIVEISLEEYVVELNREVNINRIINAELSKEKYTINNNLLSDDQTNSSFALSSPLSDEMLSSVSFPVTWYRYTQNYYHTATQSGVKVTPDYVGPATITHASSTGSSESFGANANLAAEKDAIRGGVGFTWSRTTQSSTAVTGSFNVPSGETGYITFSPKFHYTIGTLTASTYLDGRLIEEITTPSSAMCPMTLGNGITDGVFRLVIR